MQKRVDQWNNSNNNLFKCWDSQVRSNKKHGLGYEEDEKKAIFKHREDDYEGKPLYNRFVKADDFKGVPHPLSGDYTPLEKEELDDSLFVYGNRGPQIPESTTS